MPKKEVNTHRLHLLEQLIKAEVANDLIEVERIHDLIWEDARISTPTITHYRAVSNFLVYAQFFTLCMLRNHHDD